MKKSLLWLLAFVITLGAAYYQRRTGPTYPRRVNVFVNEKQYGLRLVRSLGNDERPEVKLKINDTILTATLWYKRFNTEEQYRSVPFHYKEYPVKSFVMSRIFKVTEDKGFFAVVPQQPPAGKLQYYIEITDLKGTQTVAKEDPVVIRFKGTVPGFILGPHILIMFIAMLFSTGAGLLALAREQSYKIYGVWTLILLTAGGMILGPLVQKFAFGTFWTGVPLGWDLTDNKTIIAFLFWILAVAMNLKKDKTLYTILAAIILLLVYSVPHSLFGSELDYSTGQVTQGLTLTFFLLNRKNS